MMSANLQSVKLPTESWNEDSNDSGKITWINHWGDKRTFELIADTQKLDVNIFDINALRYYHRTQAKNSNSGIIEVDTTEISGVRVIRSIYKTPQNPHGTTYTGRITIPLIDTTYIINCHCIETGATGLRENIVSLSLNIDLTQFDLKNASSDKHSKWFRDPYDLSEKTAVQYCIAEDPQWDDRFPDHPLSRVRSELNTIIDNLQLPEDVQRLKLTPPEYKIIQAGESTLIGGTLNFASPIDKDSKQQLIDLGNGKYLEVTFTDINQAQKHCENKLQKNPNDIYYIVDQNIFVTRIILNKSAHVKKKNNRNVSLVSLGIATVTGITGAILYFWLPTLPAIISHVTLVFLFFILLFMSSTRSVLESAFFPVIFSVLIAVIFTKVL